MELVDEIPILGASSVDDNCDSDLSGSKYEGFSLFDVIGNEITGKHFNVDSGEFSGVFLTSNKTQS